MHIPLVPCYPNLHFLEQTRIVADRAMLSGLGTLGLLVGPELVGPMWHRLGIVRSARGMCTIWLAALKKDGSHARWLQFFLSNLHFFCDNFWMLKLHSFWDGGSIYFRINLNSRSDAFLEFKICLKTNTLLWIGQLSSSCLFVFSLLPRCNTYTFKEYICNFTLVLVLMPKL